MADGNRKEEEEPKVVSEVNTFFVVTKEVIPLQKDTNKVARLQFTLPKSPTNKSVEKDKNVPDSVVHDEDGDLVVRRKNTRSDDLNETFMFIEYENSTKLEAVGLQVWRGAFLLADHIIANSDTIYKNKVVLEVGAGTGLTSVIAALYARKVIATDIDKFDILDLIRCNAKHNNKFVKCKFITEPLDFTDLQWKPRLEELVAEADVILAADVIYHDRITEAFVATLKKIISTGNKPKDIFIAMEKRYVFTLVDLDTVAPMYAHFVDTIEASLNLSLSSPSGPTTIVMPNKSTIQLTFEQVPLDFPQYFNYEKTKELVLWRLSSCHSHSPSPLTNGV